MVEISSEMRREVSFLMRLAGVEVVAYLGSKDIKSISSGEIAETDELTRTTFYRLRGALRHREENASDSYKKDPKHSVMYFS